MKKGATSHHQFPLKHPIVYRFLINVCLFLSIILLGVMCLCYSYKLNDQKTILNYQTHTQKLIDTVYPLLLTINTLNMHQKDYFITSNNAFTSDTDALLQSISNSFIDLNKLTQGLKIQNKIKQELEQSTKKRIDLLLQMRGLQENDGFTNESKYSLLRNGQLLSEQIIYHGNKLIDSEISDYHDAIENLSDRADLINKLFFICLLLETLLIALITYFYNKEHNNYSISNKNSIDTYSELNSILECASDMIVAVDTNLRLLNFNTSYENDFQQLFFKKITLGMLLDEAFNNLPQEKENILAIWNKSLAGNAIKKILDIKLNDKKYIYDITSNPIFNTENKIIGAVQIIRNITQHTDEQLQLQSSYQELHQGMSELKERNEKITMIVEMSDVILACETITELSDVITKYCGRILNFAGGTLYIMHASKNYLEATSHWGTTRKNTKTFSSETCWALRLGKIHVSNCNDVELFCTHLKNDPKNLSLSYLCVPLIAQNDIYGLLELEFNESNKVSPVDNETTLIKALAELAALSLANVRLRENLRYHSIRDPLTALYNRRYLEYYVTKVIPRTKSSKTEICIVMLDLDHFKSINDTYGHDAGDLVIKEFSLIITKHSRVNDLAVRYGGEEFILLLANTSLDVAKQRAEAIRSATEKMIINYDNQNLGTMSVSIGIASSKESEFELKSLIEKADKALYSAKSAGRNKIVLAKDLKE